MTQEGGMTQYDADKAAQNVAQVVAESNGMSTAEAPQSSRSPFPSKKRQLFDGCFFLVIAISKTEKKGGWNNLFVSEFGGNGG